MSERETSLNIKIIHIYLFFKYVKLMNEKVCCRSLAAGRGVRTARFPLNLFAHKFVNFADYLWCDVSLLPRTKASPLQHCAWYRLNRHTQETHVTRCSGFPYFVNNSYVSLANSLHSKLPFLCTNCCWKCCCERISMHACGKHSRFLIFRCSVRNL